MTLDTALPATSTRALVRDAVGPADAWSWRGVQDRLFAQLFSGLVYAQIWEDPDVDMAAMELTPEHHVVTIASGGCNALSYLTAKPKAVTAVDLNKAHVALVKLKIEGVRQFGDWQNFYNFFGAADAPINPTIYETDLAPHLDAATRAYWEGRSGLGARRINGFRSNIYRRGLLGKFIGAGHVLARFYGLNLREFLACQSVEAQRAYFDEKISPLFSRPLVKRMTDSPLALFGLGIPPAQYEAMAEGKPMSEVLHERMQRLACGHPLSENYFAWQAFNRGYAPEGDGPLPPYLQEQNFATLKSSIARLTVSQANMTHVLAAARPGSVDRVVLLDAQDWMTPAQLTELWQAISTAAAPGARVIFRTAGKATILPGKLPESLLAQWAYLDQLSAHLFSKDRSAIYGGFHVYQRKD